MLLSCTLYMVQRKSISVEKTFIILFGMQRETTELRKLFYCVFIIPKGNYHAMNTSTTLFYHTFLWAFIYLERFHSVPIFNGFILLVGVTVIIFLYELKCVIILVCIWSNLLGGTYKFYVG